MNAHSTQTATFGLSYQGSDVRVTCTPARLLATTVRDQFLPYGARVAAPTPDAPSVTVTVVGSGNPAPLPGGRRLQVPHSGGDLAWPEEATCLHEGPPLSVITAAPGHITVTSCGDEPYWPFLHYLVKYPVRAAVERQGGVLAHSAAVVTGQGACCLLVGPGGAGKTTALIELLARGFSLLGNDATLLRENLGRVEASLWPHVIRIGQPTITASRVLSRLPDNWAPRNPRDGKTETFLGTLNEAFGRPLGAAPAAVTAVVRVALDLGSARTRIERLSQHRAQALLDERITGDCPRTGWLPGWQWQPDKARRSSVARKLAQQVPVYQADLGAADGPGPWADELARWLSALPPPDGGPSDPQLPQVH